MAELVANCPRCGARSITFDVSAVKIVGLQHGWQQWYEAFAVCRRCARTAIFVLKESVNGDYQTVHKVGLLKVAGALNRFVEVQSHISLKDEGGAEAPEHLPELIASVFKEGAKCMAVGCYNAAGTMFRLCVDLTTKSMLPEGVTEGLNFRTRRDLGRRIPWLLDSGLLPQSLHDLSSCIKDDGNDGAHAGTLTEADAADLLDFTQALLTRIYTEPAQLREAKLRRDARRGQSQ